MSTKNISSFFKRNHEAVPKDTGESKSECTKVYNAQNIIEAEQIVELLKENHIPAFSQEAGGNPTMYGFPGFGMYGVDVLVRSDEAEQALKIIAEMENVDAEEMKVKCPYCGREMSEGQIHSFNSGMEWRTRGESIRLNTEKGLSKMIYGDRIDAYRCEHYKKIIIFYE